MAAAVAASVEVAEAKVVRVEVKTAKADARVAAMAGAERAECNRSPPGWSGQPE